MAATKITAFHNRAWSKSGHLFQVKPKSSSPLFLEASVEVHPNPPPPNSAPGLTSSHKTSGGGGGLRLSQRTSDGREFPEQKVLEQRQPLQPCVCVCVCV